MQKKIKFNLIIGFLLFFVISCGNGANTNTVSNNQSASVTGYSTDIGSHYFTDYPTNSVVRNFYSQTFRFLNVTDVSNTNRIYFIICQPTDLLAIPSSQSLDLISSIPINTANGAIESQIYNLIGCTYNYIPGPGCTTTFPNNCQADGGACVYSRPSGCTCQPCREG